MPIPRSFQNLWQAEQKPWGILKEGVHNMWPDHKAESSSPATDYGLPDPWQPSGVLLSHQATERGGLLNFAARSVLWVTNPAIRFILYTINAAKRHRRILGNNSETTWIWCPSFHPRRIHLKRRTHPTVRITADESDLWGRTKVSTFLVCTACTMGTIQLFPILPPSRFHGYCETI